MCVFIKQKSVDSLRMCLWQSMITCGCIHSIVFKYMQELNGIALSFIIILFKGTLLNTSHYSESLQYFLLTPAL